MEPDGILKVLDPNSDKIPMSAIANEFPMADNHSKVVSEHAARMGDTTVYNYAATKAPLVHTHVVNDVTGLDAFLLDKAGKDDYAFYSSGSRIKPLKEYSGTATSTLGQFVFYLTSDGTASGTAIFANSVIIGTANLVILDPSGGTYREGSYTLSADKKSLTVAVKKELMTGITILTNINVIGSATWPGIPAGVTGHISIKGT